MRTILFSVAIGLAIAGMSGAFPAESRYPHHLLSTRSISPDNTCGKSFAGANNSYTCDPMANSGGCCSQYGYCGNTTDYCGTGCQTAFGTCNPEVISNTFQCGPAFGNLACTGGLCCSGAGFCGNTTDYCSSTQGCQSNFGICEGTDIIGAPGGLCGPANGNAICSGNQCCSTAGYCGTTQDFCSDPNNCQPGFGRCDSDTTPLGPSTINAPRPALGSLTYADDIDDCVKPNVVALSYDDGPYIYTAQLLDILKQYGFTATFFMTGNNNGKGAIDTTDPYPSLIKRMIAEGHQVASHTWSHYSLDNINQASRIQQMVKNEMAFNNIIGKWPTYMRPPFSQCSQQSGCWADMQALGYHRVLFDLDTQDYLNPSPLLIQGSKDIVRTALRDAPADGDFLAIQHDIVQQSVSNFSSFFFDQIKAKGWKGVTVGECLGDDQKNWYRSLGSPGQSSTSTSTSITPSTTSTTSVASTSASTVPTSSVPTSVPTVTASSSTTTKPSSTSSKPTSGTTTAPSPTKPSSSPPPVAPACQAKIGNFCGNIATFTDRRTCNTATTTCYRDSSNCMAQGIQYTLQCYLKWTSTCVTLNAYCDSCAYACSSNGFKSKTWNLNQGRRD